jgi:hypothetical protein
MITKSGRIIYRGYSIPDPLRSFEDFVRAHNGDLEYLDDSELYGEEVKVKFAFASLDNKTKQRTTIFLGPDEFVDLESWLLLRLAAIRNERRRRQMEGYYD